MIPEINLLPEKDRVSQRSMFIVLAISMIWVFLLIFMVIQYFQIKGDIAVFQSKEEMLTAQKAGLEKQTEDATNEVGYPEAVAYIEKYIVPTSNVIKELIHLLPNDKSYLSNYSYDGNNVTIQTQFESLDMVASYVSKLNGSKFFTDVKVDSISTFSLEESEDNAEAINFKEMPRYDVNMSIVINLSSLLPAGGEADE
ncbi:PilN domain-containing protein [Caldifermentibacillus hisashii]|uniref:PilN domain-containing protein n=1 Tax=Caldifermentibacillus hisashii TaxID=996558 RepID=UPI002E22B826|nr:PilN domain-containing protein [Caldifermentibacillus hisashii]